MLPVTGQVSLSYFPRSLSPMLDPSSTARTARKKFRDFATSNFRFGFLARRGSHSIPGQSRLTSSGNQTFEEKPIVTTASVHKPRNHNAPLPVRNARAHARQSSSAAIVPPDLFRKQSPIYATMTSRCVNTPPCVAPTYRINFVRDFTRGAIQNKNTRI